MTQLHQGAAVKSHLSLTEQNTLSSVSRACKWWCICADNHYTCPSSHQCWNALANTGCGQPAVAQDQTGSEEITWKKVSLTSVRKISGVNDSCYELVSLWLLLCFLSVFFLVINSISVWYIIPCLLPSAAASTHGRGLALWNHCSYVYLLAVPPSLLLSLSSYSFWLD